MKNRVKWLCLLLTATLTLSSPMSVMATSSVQNQGGVAEDLPGMGYISIEDNYSPVVSDAEKEFSDSTAVVSYLGDTVSGDTVSQNYVPVDEEFMPEVFVDQGATNMCWAISATTACEINARKKGITDLALSASHLGYFFYNLGEQVEDPQGNCVGDYVRNISAQPWYNVGGNGRLSMWTMSDWIGAVGYAPETGSEYDFSQFTSATVFSNDTETAYLSDDVHIQNVYMSGLETDAQREAVKTLIKNVGAVTVGYYSSTDYDSFSQSKVYDDGYTLSYGNYYYDGTGDYSANHAVTVVGWDDNYSKNNFVSTPTEDGAWLIRNSWGDETNSLAQDGYFWLSYEDKGLLDEGIAIAYDVENCNNYDNIYQYDGSSGIESVEGERFVQFFDISSTQKIKALSIGIEDANRDVTASIYKINGIIDDDDLNTLNTDTWLSDILDGQEYLRGEDDSISAEKLGSIQRSISYPGYHTFDVSEMNLSALPTGTTVAVVFEFEDATNIFVDKTKTMSVWDFVASADPYLSVCGEKGTEVPLASGNALRIKMFTDNYADAEPSIIFEEENIKVDHLSTTDYVRTVVSNVTDKNDYTVGYGCEENEYLSVNAAGLLVPKKVGGPVKVMAYLYNTNGDIVASAECYVAVTAALTGLTVSDNSIEIGIGEERGLTYIPTPATATFDENDVVWSSEDDTIATVDSGGKVTGVSYGETTITCAIGTISANSIVNVIPTYTGVVLDKEEVSLKKGSSTTLMASLLPEGNKDVADFEWQSSNADVVTVNENGKITATGYGEAIITVTCGSYSDTCTVTVTGQMTGVSLDKDTAAILKGRTIQLIAQAYPEDTTDDISFSFRSANENIATVDENGLVTGIGYGETTITVSCGGFSDTCKIIVTGQLAAVVLDKQELIMKKGAAASLKATLEPEELAEDQMLVWTSSNGTVASVDENGKVTAKGYGSAVITVTCGKFSDTCNVIVDKINICKENESVTSVSMVKDSMQPLTAKWEVQEGLPSVVWKSNNTSIATVSAEGVLTAVSEGTTTISVTSGVFSTTIMVTVTSTSIEEDDEEEEIQITLSVANASSLKSMIVGQVVSTSVSYGPDTLTDASVAYRSSNSNVVSVTSSGIVTAKAAGSATLTVTLSSLQGTKTVTVPITVSENTSTEPVKPSTTVYNLSAVNWAGVKQIEIGLPETISLSLKDASGNAVSNVSYTYEADGTYIMVDNKGTICGLKSGTGVLTVYAFVGTTTVTKKFYISVIPKTSVNNGQDDEEIEDDEPTSGEISSTEDVPDSQDDTIYVTKIKLKGSTRQISKKGKLQLTATVLPTDAENKKVKWYSSNKKYATVSQKGLVKAKKAGAGHSVVISCKAVDGSGTIASYYIRITEDSVKKIKITAKQNGKTLTKKATVKAGKSIRLTAKITTTGKDVNKKVVWTSSNTKWATVSSKGKVKTKKAGKGHTVTITARALDGTKKATFKVKIKK